MKKSQLRNIIRESIKEILNEASEGELIDIHKPFRFWDEFGESLEEKLKNYKMEVGLEFDKDGNLMKKGDNYVDNIAHFPFTSRIQYVRSRTVQPRRMFGTNDDNQLLSIVRIFIKVDTENQEVIPHSTEGGYPYPSGDPVSLDGIMTLEMMAEYNHSRGGFTIDESWCKWNHPFTGKVFEFDLKGGATEGRLEDYIVKDIKFAVKKRGNRISGARFRVIENE